VLLAIFGAGAVIGAMALQRTRSLFSSDALLALGTTVFAASLWGVGAFKSVALLSVAILFGGMAWTAIISLMTTVMQNLAPDWVRARAMAVFMLVYMGTWTAGSAFWGYVAGRQGTHFSLITASIGTAVCPILVLMSRLPDTPVDLGAWDHWGKPMLVGDIDPNQGPVLVTVEYEVDPKKSEEFLEAVQRFERVRRRDGASRWGVYRDTEHPEHYVETFIVESWAEHLRQHERLTGADRELEESVGRFELKPIQVRHFIYARNKSGRL
jgi:MFS family permease